MPGTRPRPRNNVSSGSVNLLGGIQQGILLWIRLVECTNGAGRELDDAKLVSIYIIRDYRSRAGDVCGVQFKSQGAPRELCVPQAGFGSTGGRDEGQGSGCDFGRLLLGHSGCL